MALEAVLAAARARAGARAARARRRSRRSSSTTFALIIMDVQMPGMDGFQTATLIKTRDRSRHIPIIFLTAISKDAAHVFQGYAHGAVDYLMKPYDPQILRSKVSVFVELWQRGELLQRARGQAARARARAARARSRRRATRALIETMPQCVLALRPSGEPWFCNSVWRAYTGADVTATHRRGWELVHPDDDGRRLRAGVARGGARAREPLAAASCACAAAATASIAGTSCTCCRSSTTTGALARLDRRRPPTSTTRRRRATRSSAPAAPRTSSSPPSRTSCASRSTPSSAGRACCAPASSTPSARGARARDHRAQRHGAGVAGRGHPRRLAHHHRQAGARGRRGRPRARW